MSWAIHDTQFNPTNTSRSCLSGAGFKPQAKRSNLCSCRSTAWFQHWLYRDSTTATHCCLVCHSQLFSLCSVSWMQRLKSSWTCRCATTWNQRWSSYIDCRLSKELLTSCVCLCTKCTMDKHHNTCQTVYPQFLQPVTDTGWGRLAQRSTSCLEQEPDLENVVFLLLDHSSFLPSRHYWYQYFQKTTQECTFWSCLPLSVVGAPGRAPYKFRIDWLIDWLIDWYAKFENKMITTNSSIYTRILRSWYKFYVYFF